MMRPFILLLSISALLFACEQSGNQHQNSKPNPSESIDRLYQQFSTAYQTLDIDMVANLYAPDAHYLPGSSEQAVLPNRDAIRQSFTTFFSWAEDNKRDLKISFRIIKRQVDDSLAYNIGYYLIRSKPQTKSSFPDDGNVGKFVTAMGLQSDGSWKFLVDGFSPAPFAAFYADSTAHDPNHPYPSSSLFGS